jgi:uncharacterized protein YcfL
MNKKIFVVAIFAVMLLVAGCSRQRPESTAPAESVASEEKTLADQLDSVDRDLVEVDKLSQDLSVDELENVDQQLADVENLDIQ